jgi:Cu+-exporting ATPase
MEVAAASPVPQTGGQATANQKTVQMRIAGMTCAACAKGLEASFRHMAGVAKVSVDYKAGQAVITFDPAKQSSQSLAKFVTSCGYQVKETKAIWMRRVTERAAPIAAALSALATLACCLPLGIAGAVGALGLSVALESIRPWLISLALILLAIGSCQLYRGQKSCRRRSPLSLVLFGLSAVVVLAVIAYPQKLAELMAALP